MDLNKISKTGVSGFTENLIISSSTEDKLIYLWDENTGTKIFSYEDNEIKSFIARNKLLPISRFSEYLISMQENKNLITFFKTNSSDPFIKCNPFNDEKKDGKITCLTISSDNQLVFFGTSIGIVYIYELTSGNIITSYKAHTDSINCISLSINNSCIVTIGADFFIKVYLLESVILNKEENSDIIPISELIYGNKEIKQHKMIGFPNTFIICYNTDNKFMIFSFPELKLIKNIYFSQRIVSFELDKSFENLYVASDNKLFTLHLKKLWNDNNSGVTNSESFENIINSEKPITSFTMGIKNFLVGTDDGIITCFNMVTHKQSSKFSHHKGKIINILSINKPISQYGLNFNNNLEEMVVKSLKKMNNKENSCSTVRYSVNKKSSVDVKIKDYLNNYNHYMNSIKPSEVSKKVDYKLNPNTNISNKEGSDMHKKKLKDQYINLNTS